MQRNTFAVLLLCLIGATCFINHVAASCPAGYYDSSNIERPCYQCSPGTYCPGDGKPYACPSGTVAPHQGASSCSSCSTKRSNSDHTICLLADTPANAQEYVYGSNLVINSKNPYYYITLYNSFGQAPRSVQLTIAGKQPVPVTLHASYTTGKPSETNAQFSNKGVNATISFEQDVFRILYLYIVPDNADYVIGDLKLFKYLDLIENLQPNQVNYYKFNAELSQYDRNMLLFRLDNVPAGSRVNFTLNCDFWKKDWSFPFSYTLYHSTLSNIAYPNENNANIIVKSQTSSHPSTSNIFYMPKDSTQFAIAFYYDNTYYYGEMYASAKIIN
ncbi:hypothetical protein NAEGRDRAFT_79739 [Naegleria gruberi]|uniref:Tyrosine-protein kinase ephrin type A/B receptor-like domain-containing protein n=1 Tax=Naegleria gruberi TaxID=5762 RepID=D2VFC4_NAEGR|nr:uncharacterized protein NAEGRDRAFT_79739 [Naegleria gruberi]EFC44345.1 hypothetical protein NAEGRDRAFT_79739 [Naegleria gruberi]|eukprot:XP_002677089.1 hypothetical protein NAEGRDRAFT_79739 [Naegleria gruberi strain NEG-M]